MKEDIKWLQQWINDHNPNANLVVDGIGGKLTKQAFLETFRNKNARAMTEEDWQTVISKLPEAHRSSALVRIKAVGLKESRNGGWNADGSVVILYEQHIYRRFAKNKIINHFSTASHTNNKYTLDADKDGINDSWEKLADAVCTEPLAALKSISIGKFQVMGMHFAKLGYVHPIEMLWDCTNSELAHYNALIGYIYNVAKIGDAFIKISSIPADNVAFAKGYNGSAYRKNNYHVELAEDFKHAKLA